MNAESVAGPSCLADPQEPATPARATKPRRMAREPYVDGAHSPPPAVTPGPRSPSKLDQVAALLLAPDGASIAELMAVTAWQQHSVRGAMAGALKKRGLVITSAKCDGTRRYHAEQPA